MDNCQDTLFGEFTTNSETAKVMSENLGYKTVLSGSVINMLYNIVHIIVFTF